VDIYFYAASEGAGGGGKEVEGAVAAVPVVL